jgi:N-acetylmuramoyl-L-alanine amidase
MLSIIGVAGIAVILLALTAGAAWAQDAGCKGVIVLDPGHGGSDSGAVNKNGLTEKAQNLEVAYALKALLEADGYKKDQKGQVCMTRTGDQTLSNNDRYTYANTTGAKVLVSIHMNGSTNTTTDYTTTLFGKWQKDKALAQTLFKSLSTLPSATGTGTIATRAPYSYASGVLLKSTMAASIAETVFITSDKEGQLLSGALAKNPDGSLKYPDGSQDKGSNERQHQIARVLKDGIEAYLLTP